MKLIGSKLIFWVCLMTTSSVFIECSVANQADQPTKPNKCPSSNILQKIGIEKSDLIQTKPSRSVCCDANGFPYTIPGEWSSKPYIADYDTDHQWSLQLSSLRANSSEEAMQEAKITMSSLVLVLGPKLNYLGRWYCTYTSARRDISTWTVE